MKKGRTSFATRLSSTGSFPVQLACLTSHFSGTNAGLFQQSTSLVVRHAQRIPRGATTLTPGCFKVFQSFCATFSVVPSQGDRTTDRTTGMITHDNVVATHVDTAKGYNLVVVFSRFVSLALMVKRKVGHVVGQGERLFVVGHGRKETCHSRIIHIDHVVNVDFLCGGWEHCLAVTMIK